MLKRQTLQSAGFIYTLLFFLIIIFCINNIYWISFDNRIPPVHDAYPYKTLLYFDKITEDTSVNKFIRQTINLAVGPRAPFYQLLSVPNIYIFGRNIDSMLYTNLFLLILLMISTFGIAREIKGNYAGLLASLSIATFPPVIILNKFYIPHNAALSFSALSIWLFFIFIRKRDIKSCWLFILSLSLTLLSHPNTFYSVIIPSLILFLYFYIFEIDIGIDYKKETLLGKIKKK